jgi:tetratricopeptide (TPR) repeat protein
VAFDTVFQRMLLGPDVSTWQLGTMAPFVARPATRSPSAPQTTEDRPAPMFWEMNPDVAAQQTRARRSSTEERDEHVASSPLKAGRMLHLCGQFLGQPSATGYYQMVRLSDRQLAELSEGQGEQQVAVLRLAKLCATYWLGLLAFEQRNYASARDYLLARTLETTPRSPWYSGAKYNLGRVYEAEKQYAKAIQQYRGNTEAVDSFGNRLRARWLETLAKPADLEKAPGPATGKGKDQTSETPDLPGLPDLPAMPEGPGAKKKPEPPAKKTEATPKKSDAPAKKPDTEAKKTEAPTKKADTEAKKTEVPSGKR